MNANNIYRLCPALYSNISFYTNYLNNKCIHYLHHKDIYRPMRNAALFSRNFFNKRLLIENLNRRYIHQSQLLFSESDIPNWLRDIVNEVPDIKENIFTEEFNAEKEFTLENDIVNFFLSRAISYEELESSFMVNCPASISQDQFHDLFIDKNSGFGVCPVCHWEGCWEDFVEFLNSQEKILTEDDLQKLINSSSLVEETNETILASSLFNLGIEKLQELNVRLSDDQSQILMPLKGENGETVGVACVSVLHPNPEIIVRILENKPAVFTSFYSSKKTSKKVVLVSTIEGALKLAKLKIPSVVLIGGHTEMSYGWAINNFKNLILWLEAEKVPSELLTYIMSRNINAYLVKSSKDQKLSQLNNKKISNLISEAIPIDKDSILMFSDIEDEVYARIINKEKIYGIQWNRFKEINYFLLGHRRGELTVLSGPTGSGKTTFVSEYSLDLCMQGVPTLWGSFEISVPRLCEIMLQQYSGCPLSENYSEFKMLASKFCDLPLYFFNSHGQHPLQDVINVMIKANLLKGIQHVVIDNLQFMLGTNGSTADWWLEQDRAVGAFRQFATSYNCHVTLIVHPRKLALGEKLNLNTISGGARVTQEADNVLLLQVSENRDGSRNPLGPKTLQIVKNRYGGTLGEMKLRFHKDSLTLSSCFSQKKRSSDNEAKSELETFVAAKGLPSLDLDSW